MLDQCWEEPREAKTPRCPAALGLGSQQQQTALPSVFQLVQTQGFFAQMGRVEDKYLVVLGLGNNEITAAGIFCNRREWRAIQARGVTTYPPGIKAQAAGSQHQLLHTKQAAIVSKFATQLLRAGRNVK